MRNLLSTERKDSVLHVHFGTRQGSLDRELIEELVDLFKSLLADGDKGTEAGTRLVVLWGAGEAFSRGGDVRQHLPQEGGREMLLSFHDLFRVLLHPRDFRVVCAARGFAIGGALALLAYADHSIVEEGTILQQPELGLGCFPCVSIALFPLIVNDQNKVFDWIFCQTGKGEVIAPAEAMAGGLIHEVVPQGGLDEAVRSFVERHDLPAVRLSPRKAAEFEVRLAHAEREYIEKLIGVGGQQGLHDYVEGLTAFIERRPPVWQHR